MSNMLQDGLAFLADQMTSAAAVTINYRRGDQEIVGISATVGKTEFEDDDGSGLIDRVETRDFLIADGHTTLASLWPPERGDIITEILGSTQHTRTVWAPGRIRVWRQDGFEYGTRIHTGERGSE